MANARPAGAGTGASGDEPGAAAPDGELPGTDEDVACPGEQIAALDEEGLGTSGEESGVPASQGELATPGEEVASPIRSRLGRVKAWVQLWFPATAVVLALLGCAVTGYAVYKLPDTAVPHPQQSDVIIDFGSSHSAGSPIAVTLTLGSGGPYSYNGKVSLAVDLEGADLSHAGWSMLLTVPAGVKLDALYGTVVRNWNNSSNQDAVIIDPPQGPASFSTLLTWNDFSTGPLQIHGANLALRFPDVEVDNNTSSAPEPKLSVTRYLELDGTDFTYVGGQAPDQSSAVGSWRWGPSQAITINGGSGALSPGFYMEALSAAADESSSNASFKSGIAFGVGAAAFIAAIQEFVNAATDKERHKQNKTSKKQPGGS